MNSRLTQTYEQERDDRGRFGHGDGGTGGGLPRKDTHAQTEGGGKFQNGTAKEGQVTWAHEKAKEQGKSVYMEPNPKHDPKNPKAGDGGPFKLSYKPPKGEHHEVKPDGTMVYHPAPAKAPKAPKGAPKGAVVHSRDEQDSADADYARALSAARAARRLSFARAIETAVEGDAPSAARLWRAGWNKTDKGDLNFTPKSAEMVMAAYQARGNPLAWYYEHEDRLPLEKRGGAPMRGVCSAPTSDLAIRDGEGGPELWAEHIAWTDEARRQIVTGERRQLSPVAAYDEETREIVEILNVSLCSEGATHHGTLLASKEGRTGSMDLMQALMDALDKGDFEMAENIIQQMEAADGGAMMAKMGRMAMKSAKDDAGGGPDSSAPAPPPKDETATKRLAAGRSLVAVSESFARDVADLRSATADAKKAAHQSRKATVQTLIAANRDLFDTADEREHMTLADPDTTQRHIASLTRKREKGLLVASKPAETTAEIKPKKDDPPAAEKPTAADLATVEQFNRGQRDPKKHITIEEYMTSKRRTSTDDPRANTKGGTA